MAQITIAKVQSIEDIEGKDLIKKMKLEGTTNEFIVKVTDGYKVGDKVIVILNDTLIYENERTKQLKCFEFLKEKYFSTKFNCIRTVVVKMAGVKSIGLIENIDAIKSPWPWMKRVGIDLDEYFGVKDAKPDSDEKVTLKDKLIGVCFKLFPKLSIKLFKKNLSKAQKVLHPFTSLIPKSDEENAQKLSELIKRRGNDPFYATIKYEGGSATYCIENGTFMANSRTLGYKDNPEDRSNPSAKNYFYIADKYRLKELLESLNGRYVLQGEMVGPGIQKNIYGLKDLHFKIFRIKDIELKKYLTFDEITEFINKVNSDGYQLEMVDMVKKYDHLSDFIKVDNINEVCESLYKISNFEVFEGDVVKHHFMDGTTTNPKKGIYPNEGVVLHFMDGESFKCKPEVDYKLWYEGGPKACN